MWTALLPRNSILSMRNMQLKELPTLLLALLVVPVVMRVLAALVVGLAVNKEEGEALDQGEAQVVEEGVDQAVVAPLDLRDLHPL